jgi:hypothetical protein
LIRLDKAMRRCSSSLTPPLKVMMSRQGTITLFLQSKFPASQKKCRL